MRKYDIAYVPKGPANYYPAKKLEDMSLEEVVKKYIKTCGKANGNVSICSQCKTPCIEGKRAIQLLANQVYNDPPIPLYGGKTLIERAKEENLKRRENMEKTNLGALSKALEEARNEAENKPKKKKKRNYILWEDWWNTSLESGDQVKWVMDNMKLSKTQAKKKIYQYKYTHGLTKENNTAKQEEEKPKEVVSDPKPIDAGIESKLEILMRKQEECKKDMEKYMELYNSAKEKYEELQKKADILCSAMDILND